MKTKYYYLIDLEVVLLNTDYVFGFINISHIPFKKFEELFNYQITDERFLFDDSRSYEINEDLFKKHSAFFEKEIPFIFDFGLFIYNVSMSGVEVSDYKKNYYDENDLPSVFFE